MTRDTDLRDLRTVGPLLPEARTCVFSTGEEGGEISHVVLGSKFLVLTTEKNVYFFPTDTTSQILLNQNNISLKKGSTPILGGSVKKPIASMKFSDTLVHVALLRNHILVVVMEKAVQVIDLSLESLVACNVKFNIEKGQSITSAAVVSDSHFVLSLISEDTKSSSVNLFNQIGDTFCPVEMPPVNPGGSWILASSSLVAACYSTERIAILELENNHLSVIGDSGSLSPQAGDVSALRVISRGQINCSPAFQPNAFGAIVAQRDAISVFAWNYEEEQLELIFVFRDAINKVVFSSVDLIGNFIVSVSLESFTGRHRLELHDLNYLKVKSAALSPVKRWDISRLVAEGQQEAIKVFFTSKDILSFLLTGGEGAATLWEPVVRDHWFPVMANFVVLNKNEPYQESEEEFDFNQNSDMSVVKTTINRYKRSSHTVFEFLPENEKEADYTDSSTDTDMTQNTFREAETFFPFLQPLDSWKSSHNEIYQSPHPIAQTDAKFFSPACQELLTRVARKN